MTNDLNVRLEAMRARYWDWYGNCAESGSPCSKGCTAPKTGDWSDQDPGENLSHCIVRNDVPELLAVVEAVVARHERITVFAGGRDVEVCRACYYHAQFGLPGAWPCADIRALTDALGGV